MTVWSVSKHVPQALMEEKSPTRWRRRKEARTEEILSAALESFAARGFAATRIEDVAARAGISKGTLYLYFAGKEELFKAVVRQALLPNLVRIEALAASFEGPSAALLERLLLTVAGVIDSRVGAIPKLVIAEAGNFPDLARFYLDEVVRRGLGLIATILRRGIARGEFRPIDVDHAVFCVIAPMLIAALWKTSLEPHDETGPLDVQALVRAHLDMLLRGLEVLR
jgi:AcrR family transcriptional regulator